MGETDSENWAKSQFSVFSALGEQLGATGSRLGRVRLIAAYFATLAPADVEIAARLLVGRAFPEAQGRRLSLGTGAIRDALIAAELPIAATAGLDAADFGELVRRALPERDVGPALTLEDVTSAFATIADTSGRGARGRRVSLLAELLRRATPLEAKYVVKIVMGEMRHGVQEGLLLEAIAALANVPAAAVRRAQQALGDVGHIARLAKTEPGLLDRVGIRLFTPIKPMLAQTAADVPAACAAFDGQLALEWKIDGARVQIHVQRGRVRIFSRRLQDITRSLPDVVELVAANTERIESTILEGEVVAIAGDRPLPFQELMRRFRRIHDVAAAVVAMPVRLYLFDLLFLDGRSLLDEPAAARWTALDGMCGMMAHVPRLIAPSLAEAETFYAAALAAGHEGVMAKAVHSAYTPGVRGGAWLKIKASITLDLVIVAAEWGYGRRHGWLSNYHLGARDPAGGGLTVVGKTFKGPTDAEFRALTERLLSLRAGESAGVVSVRPEIVVEVRFDGIQRSPHYPCGMALRFARIVRVRDDKSPADADTVATLRRLYTHGRLGLNGLDHGGDPE